MMSKIAIKISSDVPFTKLVVPLREYTGFGITEIKNKIEKNDFFAETDSVDIEDMEKLKGLIDNLLKLGAKVQIFDSDKYGKGIFNYQEISYEEFLNYIDRIKVIMDQLQDYDDALADED